MRSLLSRLNIHSNLSTAYHPQTNGQTERANQEVEKYLRLYASRRQDDWDTQLPGAEFSYNARPHSTHGRFPFKIVYGYLPPFQIPVGKKVNIRGVDERVQRLREVQQDAQAALWVEKAQEKESYEAGKRTAHSFEVDDMVMLDTKDINLKVKTRKLADKRLGPFRVLEKVGDLDYQLDLPPTMSRIHPVFHVDKLSPWKGNEVNGIIPPPPEPVEIEGEDVRMSTKYRRFWTAGGRRPGEGRGRRRRYSTW